MITDIQKLSISAKITCTFYNNREAVLAKIGDGVRGAVKRAPAQRNACGAFSNHFLDFGLNIFSL
jgi:hypothetical protein